MLRAAAIGRVLIAAAFAHTMLCQMAMAQPREADSFARRIASAVEADTLRLEDTVRTGLGVERLAADREALTGAVREALRAAGKRIQANAAVRVQLTFSAQNGEALWVAEIVEGGRREALLFRPTESVGEAESPAAAPVALVLQPVFEQEGPILDLAMEGASMLLLERWRIARFEGQPGQWKRAAASYIEFEPAPGELSIQNARSPHARLRADGASYEVIAPGMVCRGLRPTASLACQPIDLARDDAPLPSVARWEAGGEPRRVLVVAPRTLAVQNGSGVELLRLEGFGDEVAALESSCGEPLLLLTSPGDATQPEWLRAVSVEGGEARERSASVELRGRLTALWPTSEPNRVLAIVHEEARNRYVAFHVFAVCGQ